MSYVEVPVIILSIYVMYVTFYLDDDFNDKSAHHYYNAYVDFSRRFAARNSTTSAGLAFSAEEDIKTIPLSITFLPITQAKLPATRYFTYIFFENYSSTVKLNAI